MLAKIVVIVTFVFLAISWLAFERQIWDITLVFEANYSQSPLMNHTLVSAVKQMMGTLNVP